MPHAIFDRPIRQGESVHTGEIPDRPPAIDNTTGFQANMQPPNMNFTNMPVDGTASTVEPGLAHPAAWAVPTVVSLPGHVAPSGAGQSPLRTTIVPPPMPAVGRKSQPPPPIAVPLPQVSTAVPDWSTNPGATGNAPRQQSLDERPKKRKRRHRDQSISKADLFQALIQAQRAPQGSHFHRDRSYGERRTRHRRRHWRIESSPSSYGSPKQSPGMSYAPNQMRSAPVYQSQPAPAFTMQPPPIPAYPVQPVSAMHPQLSNAYPVGAAPVPGYPIQSVHPVRPTSVPPVRPTVGPAYSDPSAAGAAVRSAPPPPGLLYSPSGQHVYQLVTGNPIDNGMSLARAEHQDMVCIGSYVILHLLISWFTGPSLECSSQKNPSYG